MSDWFTWKGENFYAVRGEELHYLGAAIKRDGEDKWDVYHDNERGGVFLSEAAARQRVEKWAAGFFRPPRATWKRGEGTERRAGWQSADFWARPRGR